MESQKWKDDFLYRTGEANFIRHVTSSGINPDLEAIHSEIGGRSTNSGQDDWVSQRQVLEAAVSLLEGRN